ncbi:hypothetical protein PPYR_05461 [Photinus pyralis]|uniref:Dynein light chain n=1 Tax=Photinus pyralis TaxID=7054 RepID=A0A5N4AUV5_PHOPY|nr:hypothetical protein PPYR_05461 [Photinus pyralis]
MSGCRIAGMARYEVRMKINHMQGEMKQDAIRWAAEAIDSCGIINHIETATFIQKKFAEKYQGSWQCIVGRQFGSFVAYVETCYTFFYVNNISVLIYKSDI